jgi:hypothetical protein
MKTKSRRSPERGLAWAIKKFHKFQRANDMAEDQPANTSTYVRGVWHLHNVNGRLAQVFPDGSVILG